MDDSQSNDNQVTVISSDYSQQLQSIYECQQLSVAFSCVLCGLLLSLIILNVFKRFI